MKMTNKDFYFTLVYCIVFAIVITEFLFRDNLNTNIKPVISTYFSDIDGTKTITEEAQK